MIKPLPKSSFFAFKVRVMPLVELSNEPLLTTIFRAEVNVELANAANPELNSERRMSDVGPVVVKLLAAVEFEFHLILPYDWVP